MHRAAGAAALMLLLGSLPAWSQEWSLYLAFDDVISINFPGDPKITGTTYTTEHGAILPARVYSAKDEFGTYSLTVVDWSTAEPQHAAQYKKCMEATGDLRGGENPAICGNRSRNEIAGATLYAAYGFLERGGKVAQFGSGGGDGVDGVTLELLNPDRSQTFAQIAWHEGRLYIAEGTAPQGAPPPDAFTVSMQFIDKEGRRIQYASRYTPGFPVPQRRR
jgi:hypothetical protein